MTTYARSEETINNILEAAERQFVRRAYADVTMQDIAEAAKVTKGALYHHFASKEALYLAMLRANLTGIRDAMLAAVPAEGSSYEKLRALTCAYLQRPGPKRDVIHLVRRDVNVFREPLRTTIVRAYQEAVPIMVEAIMREGVARGEIEPHDPRILSWSYVALIEMLLAPYAQEKLGGNEGGLDYALHFFFKGAGTGAGRELVETEPATVITESPVA
ncbi:MAG: TetR/AcrR family transcriptional regulator [Ardenticatenaceae bacterium]|nr:TetR/AcrR family transcriptional regulator [Ardenticatenaceae bacterium]